MEEKKEPLIIKIGLGLFYLVILAAIVLGGLYFWNEKQTFYLFEDEIQMPLNANYTIRLMGKTETKSFDDFEYKSSNENVVSVDEFGVIHANSSGSATISVKAKNSKNEKTIDVVVGDDDIFLIDFENEDISLTENEKYQLKPLINGESNYNTDLVYTSSDKNILSVDKNGKCTAKKAGTVFVEVKLKGSEYSNRIRITVNKEEKKVAVKNTKDNTKKEETKKQEDTKKDEPKKQEETKKQEENDEFGVSEEVIVTHVYVNDVTLKSNKSKIKVGEKLQLEYSVVPSNATNKNVTFTSDNETVATVSKTGVVTGVSAGTVKIVIKTNENKKTAVVSLTIEEDVVNVKSIKLNKSETSILTGDKEKLYATISPSNATNQKVSWSSSNNKIASVDSSGNVTAVSVGSATISVQTKDGGYKAVCAVNVKQKVINVKSITLNKTSLSLAVGGSSKLSVTIDPSDATDQSLTWSSSDSSIAVVNQEGKVTGKKEGTATITVTNGKLKQTCSVTVKKVALKELNLVSNSTIRLDDTDRICVTFIPANTTNKKVTWSSSNSKIVKVDSSGNIKGISLGTATITVTSADNNKKTSVKITVIPKDDLIDISNAKYKSFAKFQTYADDGEYQHVQNFAISNITKDNQIIYISGTQYGKYPVSYDSLTADQKANLIRTIVYKIEKNDIDDPAKRTRMYLEKAGHGQSFDIEPNSDIMWVNSDGKAYAEKSATGWWGYSRGIMRIKFKETPKKGEYSPLVSLKITDSSDKVYKNIAPSIDKANDLILMQSGLNIFIYKFSDFKNGKKTLIYSFKVNSKLEPKQNDRNVSSQGTVIKGGYIYQVRGGGKTDNYIEAFDLTGKSIYTKKIGVAKDRTEPEGIRIYKNKIFFGRMSLDKYFEIGYYTPSELRDPVAKNTCN